MSDIEVCAHIIGRLGDERSNLSDAEATLRRAKRRAEVINKHANDYAADAEYQGSRVWFEAAYYFDEFPCDAVQDQIKADVWDTSIIQDRRNRSAREVQDGDGWFVKVKANQDWR